MQFLVRTEPARKVVEYANVSGIDNPAAVCTKGLYAELMTKHVLAVHVRHSAGRPTLCPEVLGMLDSVEQCCSTDVQLVRAHFPVLLIHFTLIRHHEHSVL